MVDGLDPIEEARHEIDFYLDLKKLRQGQEAVEAYARLVHDRAWSDATAEAVPASILDTMQRHKPLLPGPCPVCGESTNVALTKVAYCFETCDCDQAPYEHLVERLYHLSCMRQAALFEAASTLKMYVRDRSEADEPERLALRGYLMSLTPYSTSEVRNG